MSNRFLNWLIGKDDQKFMQTCTDLQACKEKYMALQRRFIELSEKNSQLEENLKTAYAAIKDLEKRATVKTDSYYEEYKKLEASIKDLKKDLDGSEEREDFYRGANKEFLKTITKLKIENKKLRTRVTNLTQKILAFRAEIKPVPQEEAAAISSIQEAYTIDLSAPPPFEIISIEPPIEPKPPKNRNCSDWATRSLLKELEPERKKRKYVRKEKHLYPVEEKRGPGRPKTVKEKK